MSPESDPGEAYKPNWVYVVGLLILGVVSFLGMARLLPLRFVIVLHVVLVGLALTSWAYGRRG
jgi:hypothetical protein